MSYTGVTYTNIYLKCNACKTNKRNKQKMVCLLKPIMPTNAPFSEINLTMFTLNKKE